MSGRCYDPTPSCKMSDTPPQLRTSALGIEATHVMQRWAAANVLGVCGEKGDAVRARSSISCPNTGLGTSRPGAGLHPQPSW